MGSPSRRDQRGLPPPLPQQLPFPSQGQEQGGGECRPHCCNPSGAKDECALTLGHDGPRERKELIKSLPAQGSGVSRWSTEHVLGQRTTLRDTFAHVRGVYTKGEPWASCCLWVMVMMSWNDVPFGCAVRNGGGFAYVWCEHPPETPSQFF